MRFLHLADLHVGKIVNGVSMIADQEHVFEQIKRYIQTEQVDGVLLAGDLYDRSVPSSAAIRLFDEFLADIIIRLQTPVYAIAGNHDGSELLNFGSRLLSAAHCHIEGKISDTIQKVTVRDEYGPLNIYLLPFSDYAVVRETLSQPQIKSLHEATKALLETTPIDESERNILLYHGFVTGGDVQTSDSEKCLVVGGKEEVSYQLFDAFDYVALGHLHGAQRAGRETIRYAGTPLKYSFSEERHQKSVTLIDVLEKGHIDIQTKPLIPLKEMRTIEGTLEEVLLAATPQNKEDYLRVILTDEGELLEPMNRLKQVYPNTMILELKKHQQEVQMKGLTKKDREQLQPEQLFSQFYEQNTERKMSEEELSVIQKVLNSIQRGSQL